MSATIALIRRHPIKAIGGQDLRETALHPARALDGDRQWALLHQGGERHAGETPHPERWLPKSCFLQGAKSSRLQAIQGGLNAQGRIALAHPDLPELEFAPETQGQQLIDWITPLWPEGFPAPTRLVRAPTAFADVSQPWLSILSLSTLSDLESRLGQSVGTSRWRGNIWIEGWPPSHERDLIGRILTVGDVELRVVEPIGRCAATSADTETGQIDIDMPAALKRHFGHSDFGIYAQVVTGGIIRPGDRIDIQDQP